MQRFFVFIFLVLACTVSCSKNYSKNFEYINANSWQSINSDLKSNKLSAQQTLIILDYDNTLLQTAGYIGSPQWFDHQVLAIKNKANGKQNKVNPIVPDSKTFYPLNNFVLSLVPKKLVENGIPAIIKDWQQQGYSVMIVTSRDPNVRFSTQRGLINHGIYISDYACTGVTCSHGVNHVLYLDKQHKHAYMHGFLFTTGGDKAITVQQLFAAAKPAIDFKNYVVVDDTAKNLDDFKKWFKPQHSVSGLYLYHYNREPTYTDADKNTATINPAIVALYQRFGSENRVY